MTLTGGKQVMIELVSEQFEEVDNVIPISKNPWCLSSNNHSHFSVERIQDFKRA
jgi:hypothetical protein